MSKELLELNQKLGENITALRAEFKELQDSGKTNSEAFVAIQDEMKKLDDKQQAILKANEANEKALKEQAESADLLEKKLIDMSKPTAKGGEGKAYKATDEYKAFNSFVVNGLNKLVLDNPEYKDSLRTDTNSQGGYLVPTDMASTILKEILEVSDVRKYARVWTGMGKSFSIPVRNGTGVIKAKGEGESAEDTTQTYRNETLTGYRQTANIPMTLDIINFSAFDIEAEAIADIRESFANYEGEKFLKGAGSGAKEPEGILVNSDVVSTDTTQSSGSITNAQLFEDVVSLIALLKKGYNGSYAWNRDTLVRLRLAQSSAGGFLWQIGGETIPSQLMGYNYSIMQDMQSIGDGAGAKVAMFADLFRGYSIYDSVAMNMVRDEYTNAKNAMINLIFHRWSTGQVVIPEAIKLLDVKA